MNREIVKAVLAHDMEAEHHRAEGMLEVIEAYKNWRMAATGKPFLPILQDLEEKAKQALLPPLLRDPNAKVHKRSKS